MAALGMAGADDLGPRFAGDFVYEIFPAAGFRVDVAFDAGPIDFMDAAIFELLAELAGRAKILGENDRAACRTVKPMGHAEVNPLRTRRCRPDMP